MKYRPGLFGVLTQPREPGAGTVHGGQFDWGGLLPKSNGGARRCVQRGRKSRTECKGINALDCEAYRPSRCESRS